MPGATNKRQSQRRKEIIEKKSNHIEEKKPIMPIASSLLWTRSPGHTFQEY